MCRSYFNNEKSGDDNCSQGYVIRDHMRIRVDSLAIKLEKVSACPFTNQKARFHEHSSLVIKGEYLAPIPSSSNGTSLTTLHLSSFLTLGYLIA